MPEWLKGDVLDVRKVITYYLALQEGETPGVRPQKIAFPKVSTCARRQRSFVEDLCSEHICSFHLNLSVNFYQRTDQCGC